MKIVVSMAVQFLARNWQPGKFTAYANAINEIGKKHTIFIVHRRKDKAARGNISKLPGPWFGRSNM